MRQQDALLGEVLGCDLRVLDEEATAADLLDALDRFAAANLADCKGCDGCCQERAPLTAPDLPALAALLPATEFPAHSVVEKFGCLSVEDGVSDIILRRLPHGPCCQLDQTRRCCTIWPNRPLVCRSHFCLPRSSRLELLRQDIVNLGLNELTRLLLAEEALGAPALEDGFLVQQLDPADYPVNACTGRNDWAQLRLKDCVDAKRWAELTAPADITEQA